MALAKYAYPNRFYDFFRILISTKYFTTQQKSLKVLDSFSFILFVAQSLTVSLALYFLWIAFGGKNQDSSILYIQIFVAYNIFIGGKYLIEKIIASLFSIEKILDNYLFYKITYKNLVAFCLLPLLLLLTYSWRGSFYFLLISLVLYFIFNLIILTGFYKNNQKIVFGHWFYFILYLCTLEIAPYFILYKVFTAAS